MNSYIDEKIYGLPKPLRKGHNSSPNKGRKGREYIHNVIVGSNKYYKVHVKRQNVSKIRYFKKLKEAKLFLQFLRENKYL